MSIKSLMGFLWLLPTTILLWLFYVLPLWLTRQVKYHKREKSFIWSFEVIAKDNWYARRWDRWAGWSGPCVYFFNKQDKKDFPHVSEKLLKRYNSVTKIHELRHCDQQFVFGPFHYPLYFLASGWIGLSNLWRKSKRHMHLDNPFERDARKAAGQRLDIPPSEWPDGPRDYNPWL